MTYELLTGEGVTGVGTLDDQKLTVTKCGTFKIKVTTSAVNDTAGDPLYSEGEAVATLTVKKAAGSMGDVTVANIDSAKTDIIYGDTWTASTKQHDKSGCVLHLLVEQSVRRTGSRDLADRRGNLHSKGHPTRLRICMKPAVKRQSLRFFRDLQRFSGVRQS